MHRILLCRGNQGKSIINRQGLLQIRFYQLNQVNKEEILKQFIKQVNPPQTPVNLLTCNPRNYYIDKLLQKNVQLIEDDQEQKHSFLQQIKWPLQLQVIFPDNKYRITSSTQVSLQYFKLKQKIGQGTFAQIYLAESRYDDSIYTIKRINKTELLQNGTKQMVINQLMYLQIINPAKVYMYYSFQTQKYVYFVMDYCPFGDLYKILRQQKKFVETVQNCKICDLLSYEQRIFIWMHIAMFITNLHSRNIIYRDLKPENILIDELGIPKLCDFGYCTNIKPNQKLTELCGSYEYLPPQLMHKQGYNKSFDIYCLGILLYEILTNKNPFEGITPQNMKQLKDKTITYPKKFISPLAKDLIESLIRRNPQERLGYDNTINIFSHDFFQMKQNQSIILKILNCERMVSICQKIKFTQPIALQERNQLLSYQQKWTEGFNYLKPNFDVGQKMGPKFNSSF